MIIAKNSISITITGLETIIPIKSSVKNFPIFLRVRED